MSNNIEKNHEKDFKMSSLNKDYLDFIKKMSVIDRDSLKQKSFCFFQRLTWAFSLIIYNTWERGYQNCLLSDQDVKQ